MTQSYFESLGRAASRPPDISKTNYLEEEPTEALVDKKNQEIDKAIKDSEAFHKANIEMFNAAHAQKMENINKLINFMPKAKRIIEQQQKFADYRNDLATLEAVPLDYLKQNDELEKQADGLSDEMSVAFSGEQGQLEADGAPPELVHTAAAESLSTPNQSRRSALNFELQMLPSRYAEAQRFLTLRDGRGYNELISTADHQEFFQTASALALQTLREQHPDMPDRLLARKWIPAYRQAREAYFADVATKQNTLFKNAFDTKNKINLWSSAQTGTVDELFGETGYIKRRAAYFNSLIPGEGMKLARNEFINSIEEGIKEEYVTKLDFLDQEFIANDGSRTTFQKKFPNEATKLRGALDAQNAKRIDAALERENNSKKLFIDEYITQFEGVKDYDWMQSTAKAYRQKFQTTDYPEELKRAYTESYEDEFDKIRRLAHVASQGGSVTMEDIATIQNPTLKEKALKLVNRASLSAVPKEIETDSKTFIKSNIAKYTFENDLSKAMTPKFRSIERQAYKEFVNKFAELKGQNQSDEIAQRGAEEHVLKRIKDGDFDVLPSTTYDKSGAYDINIARAAISVDPQIIYANTAMAGESPYLAEAETFFKSDFKKGSIPEYYTLLSKLYPDLDPHQLARIRLESVGILKPETKGDYDDVENPRLLTDKNTSSKTMRSAFTGENMNWILDRITNPLHKENGGFDAIFKDGKPVKLDKPLSQHTLMEVLGITEYYDNFGMYGITGSGIIQAVQANGGSLDLDDLFDENLQKALVLARLRHKNQQGKALNGLPTFRRLVNIPKAEREEFYKIVGDVPPMNQLDNLLPAVAKAVVEATLQ